MASQSHNELRHLSREVPLHSRYSAIQLKEIALPDPVINILDIKVPLTNIIKDANELSIVGTTVYSTAWEHLTCLKHEAFNETISALIVEHLAVLKVFISWPTVSIVNNIDIW